MVGYTCGRLHVWLATCVVGYMCGQLHVWSATCVVGYMCSWLHVWLATRAVSYMCGRLHVWSVTCGTNHSKSNVQWAMYPLIGKGSLVGESQLLNIHLHSDNEYLIRTLIYKRNQCQSP